MHVSTDLQHVLNNCARIGRWIHQTHALVCVSRRGCPCPEGRSLCLISGDSLVENWETDFLGVSFVIATIWHCLLDICVELFVQYLFSVSTRFAVRISVFSSQLKASETALEVSKAASGQRRKRARRPPAQSSSAFCPDLMSRDALSPTVFRRLRQANIPPPIPQSCHPINALPVEMLSLIFEHVVLVSEYGSLSPFSVRDPVWELYRTSSARRCQEDCLQSVRAPVSLSHVCRWWRAVALSSPSLWNNLFIGSPLNQLHRTFLNRAKQFPLTIAISIPRCRQMSTDDLTALFRFVKDQLIRCRSLSIITCQHQLELFLQLTYKRSAPILESVVLATPRNYEWSPQFRWQPAPIFTGHLPNLRELSLDHYIRPFPTLSLDNLSSITLSWGIFNDERLGIVLSDFQSMLQQSAALDHGASAIDSDPTGLGHVLLPRLLSFKIIAKDIIPFIDLLSQVHTPCLHTLCFVQTNPSSNTTFELSPRSTAFASVRDLFLVGQWFTFHTICPLLRAMENIQCLSLKNISRMDAIIVTLGNDGTLPCLSTLVLVECTGFTVLDCTRMIFRRWFLHVASTPNRPRSSRLDELIIEDCQGMGAQAMREIGGAIRNAAALTGPFATQDPIFHHPFDFSTLPPS